MFESFGFETTTAKEISVLFALTLGALFGLLAERTGFCLRRAVVGPDRPGAAGVWLAALAVAILGTQAAVQADLISFADHRFLSPDLPVLAIVTGGLLFGAGMVLTRGCVSRLTVLAGTGNLRAFLVVLVFAVVAHATLKGVLAPLRVALGSVSLSIGEFASLAALPGGALTWSMLIVLAAAAVALRSGASTGLLLGGAAIGALVPLGWVGTGYVLLDEFDPIAMESLSFTSPSAEALFFTLASSSIPAGFGPGLIGGVLAGALAASLLFGTFRWQSFDTPRQTGCYLAGAALMGIGGVLAGGCTVGAGLSGVPTLALSAIIALVAIVIGGWVMGRIIQASGESGAPSSTPAPQPAE